jgi:hypothetical protein
MSAFEFSNHTRHVHGVTPTNPRTMVKHPACLRHPFVQTITRDPGQQNCPGRKRQN